MSQGKEVELKKKAIVLFTNGIVMDMDDPVVTRLLVDSRKQSEYNEHYRTAVGKLLEGNYAFYLAKWNDFVHEITLDEFCLLYYGESSEQLRKGLDQWKNT